MNKIKLNKIFIFAVLLLSFGVIGISPNFAQQPKSSTREDPALKAAREGDEAYTQGNYQVAADKYTQAIRLAPVNPYCYFWRGASQMNLRLYSDSLDSYNRALTQGYKPAKDVYAERWRAKYFLNDLPGAESDLREGIRLDAKDVNLRLILTDILRTQKKYGEAVNLAEEAKRIDPNNGDINFYAALIYSDQKNYLYSTTEALDAIKKKSQYAPDARTIIAGNLVLVRKYEDAIQQYKAALQEKPSLINAYWGLAVAYQAENRLNEAIQILEKAVPVDPKNGTTQINLSFVASLAGDHLKAMQAGKLAIQYEPQQQMGYTNLCRAYNDLKRFDEAIESCNQALDIKNADGETSLYLGLSYKNKSNKVAAKRYFEQAVKGLEQFVRENPDQADAYFLLGNAYVEVEQWGKAVINYTKAIDISDKFVKAHYNLGNAYLKINDIRSAREQYAKLKLLDPQRAAQLLANINAVSGAKSR